MLVENFVEDLLINPPTNPKTLDTLMKKKNVKHESLKQELESRAEVLTSQVVTVTKPADNKTEEFQIFKKVLTYMSDHTDEEFITYLQKIHDTITSMVSLHNDFPDVYVASVHHPITFKILNVEIQYVTYKLLSLKQSELESNHKVVTTIIDFVV